MRVNNLGKVGIMLFIFGIVGIALFIYEVHFNPSFNFYSELVGPHIISISGILILAIEIMGVLLGCLFFLASRTKRKALGLSSYKD